MRIISIAALSTFLCWGSSRAHAEAPLRATTMEWKVLGLNPQSGVVAFKILYTQVNPEPGEGIDCDYKGVKVGEYVQLGAWNTTDNTIIQTWNVYPSADDESQCASEKQSKAVLQAAKDYYRAQNIDISKPPSFILPKDGVFTISKEDKSIRTFRMIDAVETPSPDDDSYYTYTRALHNEQGAVVHQFQQDGTRMMASRMSFSYIRAYKVGNKVAFLQEFQSSSMRHSDISYWLTPLVSLD